MIRLLPTILALALGFSCLQAADFSKVNQPEDQAEQDTAAWSSMQSDAAEYFRNRASAPKEQFNDAEAKRYLDRARELLTTGHEIRARWWAEDAFEEFPYSSYAGDALRMGMEGAAVQGNIGQVREKLQMLWLYIPDYPGLPEAMDRAMSVTEDLQNFSKSVNLEAPRPGDVISVDGRSALNDTASNRLLAFLSIHGDRDSIAPRAALGLARGQLLAGGKEDIFAARRAYEQFLEQYPNNSLTFTAICEYALSYLISYRGENYDLGALVLANAIIDQAEIETRGDAAKVATVQAYRKRIRAWLQDRDLSVARWYYNRGTPWIFIWLIKPPLLLSWDDGARYYWKEVIKREPTSTQGRTAESELSEVPQTRPDTLGPNAQ